MKYTFHTNLTIEECKKKIEDLLINGVNTDKIDDEGKLITIKIGGKLNKKDDNFSLLKIKDYRSLVAKSMYCKLIADENSGTIIEAKFGMNRKDKALALLWFIPVLGACFWDLLLLVNKGKFEPLDMFPFLFIAWSLWDMSKDVRAYKSEESFMMTVVHNTFDIVQTEVIADVEDGLM